MSKNYHVTPHPEGGWQVTSEPLNAHILKQKQLNLPAKLPDNNLQN